MVHHYKYGNINSHYKVLVNLHASNMDALKTKTIQLDSLSLKEYSTNCVLCGV